MKNFDLQYQYKLYLKRVNLDESKMPEVQNVEMKRIFIGACGQMLVILKDDLAELPEDKAIEQLDNMFNQVADFFMNETQKLN